MRTLKISRLIGLVALCLLVGGVGGYVTAGSVNTWFVTLAKPPWNPPSYVFGPVWTALYIMMAVAMWLSWRRCEEQGQPVRSVSVVFGVQLVLNLLWSCFFFGLQSPGLALVNIAFLLCAILVTLSRFARVSKLAAWLLVPYVLWVCYASSLNAAIWWLNRG